MNTLPQDISFDNTEFAFAYKSKKALKKAQLLFSSMGYSWLVKLGTRLTPWAMKAGLPVNGLIRNTIFEQFVGGESLDETAKVAAMLQPFNVQVILDYGVEGKEGEPEFEHACQEFIRVINYAARQPNIPFVSIKVTAFARFGLLQKLNDAARPADGANGIVPVEVLSKEEEMEWERVKQRLEKVIAMAVTGNIGVLIDAEESWVQQPVDALSMRMMEKYNTSGPVVYNTVQCYRRDRFKFLQESVEQARQKKFILGVKLVRGAYMEKERKRASENNYPSPIQPDKTATDGDYDAAVAYCIGHLDDVAVIVASHNERSNLLATTLLRQKGFPLNHPHIHFSQLYGMSDNITFNLAKAGCSVSKYLPFGPIKEVIPYLMRRAQENSAVSGQTGRELGLISKELKRRARG